MDRLYVEWIRVEKFRCIRSVDLHLTPLHAFIGPNDSGKSSLLRAIQQSQRTLWLSNGAMLKSSSWSWGQYPSLWSVSGPLLDKNLADKAVAAVTIRLDPDELRRPAALIPQGQPLWFRSERGEGLPALYDALLSRNIPAFLSIANHFTKLFPTVRALRMVNRDDRLKTLGLTLADDTEIGPEEVSEGMLYWLAFAIIEHLSPVGMLLIEEPENGLHPSRITEVVRILREVSKRTQVVMATHSPLVINELTPEEVTIVTRKPETGTICTPMTQTKNFAERSKAYALGELWLSYADGDLERELVPEEASAVKVG